MIPPLPEIIKLHEEVAKPVKPCKVTGICLNTQELPEEEAKQEIEKVEAQTGLPVTDPVRFGCKGLVRALEFLRN